MSRRKLASSLVSTFAAALGLAIATPAMSQVPVGDFYFFDRSEDGTQQASVT